MIDCENEIYTRISQAIIAEYPDADVSGAYDLTPPSLPHVSIEMTNSMNDFDDVDRMMFTVEVYSQKPYGKKEEAKSIMQIVDDKMRNMNFGRTSCTPVANVDDPTIYRLVARFEGASDGINFYRR